MQKHCEHCGKLFEAARTFKKYCSDTCKQYAYVERSQFQKPVIDVNQINDVNQSVNKNEDPNNLKELLTDIKSLLIKLNERPNEHSATMDKTITLAHSYVNDVNEKLPVNHLNSENVKDSLLTVVKKEIAISKRVWKSEFMSDLRHELFHKGKGAKIFWQHHFPQWDAETLEMIRAHNEFLQELLRETLRLQFQTETTWDELQDLYDQYEQLKEDNTALPEDYPYHELIENLLSKIEKVFVHQQSAPIIKFHFHPSLRFELIKTICEIGYNYDVAN
ncbi:MAG: hypothetical protein RL065_2097 [Bacteroidota bacterium]|jgi:hypothetical protein